MSQNSCCVPGCSVTRKDDVLHRFPNPDTNIEKFEIWIANIGGELRTLNTKSVYDNRRVCRRHFKDMHKYPNNRLSGNAVPVLHIMVPGQEELVQFDSPSSTAHFTLPAFAASQVAKEESSKPLILERPEKRSREQDIDEKTKKEKRSKTIKSTAPQGKMLKVVKQLHKCQLEKKNFKRKYMLAKRFTKTEAFKIISKDMTSTAKIFCRMQAFQSGKKKQGRRFSLDEKILALSLYKPSPKAYRFLSNICVLPTRRTLQSMLQKIDLKPGINDIIFKNLKQRVKKMPETHKFCSLILDEMAIAPGVSYDKKYDEIKGLVGDGKILKNEYCDHVLVFMVRGVVKKYKQPLAYYFCSGSTKAIDLKIQIKEVINQLHKIGLKVITTVCDQGASNIAAINMLIKETEETYLRKNKCYRGGFFKIGNKKIFPLYDAPHLIKGIRNNLLTKDLKYLMNNKECVAKWSHIIGLYNRSPGYRGVKLVPKLTANHVFPEQIPKMRVKNCTQVFSKTVGAALGCMAELGALEEQSTETADLILFFDDLFDSLNGSFSQVKNGKVYRSAVTPSSPHHKLWDYSLPILKSMKFINAKNQGVVPSLSSWIKTIENIKRITKHLSRNGVNSLLLRNFNQDPLENFFGAIRAHGHSNVMPTASGFEGAYKTLLVNNITSPHSVGSNCEKDDSVCLQSLKHLLMKEDEHNTTECGGVIDSELNTEEIPPKDIDNTEIDPNHLNMEFLNIHNLLSSKASIDVEKSAAIGYCSGWIAQLAKKKIFKNCAVCENNLLTEELLSFHQYIKCKEYENKKWLCYPTRALFDFFAQVENISIEILKNHMNKRNISSYIQLVVTINLGMPFLTCCDHKNMLGKYLIEKSTSFFINNWCKDITGILTGKSPLWDNNDLMKVKAYRHYSKNKGRKRRRQV